MNTDIHSGCAADGARPVTMTDLLGNRRPIPEIAAALGVKPRAVNSMIDRYGIPYVTVLKRRYVDPAEIRGAIEREASNA